MINEEQLNYIRGKEEHKQYCRDMRALQSNNFYIALDNKGEVHAIAELDILSREHAKLVTYIEGVTIRKKKVIAKFIDVVLYWNPFLKVITHTYGEYYHQSPKSIFNLLIDEIQPSQLSISEKKLKNVAIWLDSKDKVVIPVIRIDDKYVATDGHTRLVQAYFKGYKDIFVFIDTDVNIEQYNVFMSWCLAENINTVKGLANRIISAEEHEIKWIGRCKKYLRSLKES